MRDYQASLRIALRPAVRCSAVRFRNADRRQNHRPPSLPACREASNSWMRRSSSHWLRAFPLDLRKSPHGTEGLWGAERIVGAGGGWLGEFVDSGPEARSREESVVHAGADQRVGPKRSFAGP
jgi:hypothetical protein